MDYRKEIEAAVREAQAADRRVMASLREKLASLPQNPPITELSPVCFTLPASELFRQHPTGNNALWAPQSAANLSPYFHNFRWQYEHVMKRVEATALEKKVPLLRSLAAGRRLLVEGKWEEPLHPDVMAELAKLVGFEGNADDLLARQKVLLSQETLSYEERLELDRLTIKLEHRPMYSSDPAAEAEELSLLAEITGRLTQPDEQ